MRATVIWTIILVVTLLPASANSESVVYEGREYPVANTLSQAMSDPDFCTLQTGVWCEGVIQVSTPDVVVAFTTTPVLLWRIETMRIEAR